MNSLKIIGKILFLLFAIFYIFIPFILVLETKINRPNFKNLNNNEFILLGVILLIFILINIRLFYPYFKKNLKS
jgi:hypothetical protein